MVGWVAQIMMVVVVVAGAEYRVVEAQWHPIAMNPNTPRIIKRSISNTQDDLSIWNRTSIN